MPFIYQVVICNVKTSFVVTLLLFDNFIKTKSSKHCKLGRAPSTIRTVIYKNVFFVTINIVAQYSPYFNQYDQFLT